MADNRIRVFDGSLVDPFNPTPDHIRPWNFIHSSSQINRYAGNGRYPYSIGQHSYNLVQIVPKHLRRAALIHDWGECWFQDMPQPIKVRMPEYKAHEHHAMVCIGLRFGVSEEEFEELSWWDRQIYIDERNAFVNMTDDIGMGDDRTGLGMALHYFREMNWRTVRAMNHATFNTLFPEHQMEYRYGE